MAEHDLITPLLPNDGHSQPCDESQVIITVDGDLSSDEQFSNRPSTQNGQTNNNQLGIENPFEFLGANGIHVPPACTIDPFRNHTPRVEGVYEWLKILICVPIAILRLVLFGLSLLVGYVATKFALHGWKDKQNPMPKWRCRLMWVTRISARCILFSFGYHWIKRRGRPAPRETAPIVVSNHVSYIEPIFFFYELFPTIVASESHDSIPFVGTIIRAMQVIYVNRFSPSSRKHAVSEIKRKASSGRFPRLLLFPEGTTTNGRLLISFQLGAFIPGYPIQPVVVRYPYVHFDQSWGNIALAKLMFRMFTQFHNFMEVEYLPVVSPLENQKENAVHFAEKTSHAIATALNVMKTSYSYGDFMLLAKASESKQENPALYMVEMAMVESTFHLSSLEAVDFLDTFFSMNPDTSGHVKINDFLRVLRLKACSFTERIFGLLDVEQRGKITFKQFLFGSAHVLKQPLFRQACEFAFTECLTDVNQYISEQELGDFIKLAIPNLEQYEVHDLFNLFDTDHDGRISREDFFACLRRNPLLIALFSPQLMHKNFSGIAKGGDCIGSAFNVKGAMQCPNCRKVERGQWLFASGPTSSFPEFVIDDWTPDDYVFNYSEVPLGVHWCPFGGLAQVHSSFEEVESASTTYHNLQRHQAIFAEHTSASSVAHSYVAYLGPIPPVSSNTNESVEDPNFNHHWNGISGQNDIFTAHGFPVIDVQYQSWGHHSHPYSSNSGHIDRADRASIAPATVRPTGVESDNITRFGSVVHPSFHSRGNSRSQERTSASLANGIHHQRQLSNPPGVPPPIIPLVRRSNGPRGLATSQSDQSGGFFNFPPPGPSSRNPHVAENSLANRIHPRERNHLPHPVVSFDWSAWGPFHHAHGGSDSTHRSGNFWGRPRS